MLSHYRAAQTSDGVHPASILILDPPHREWEGLLFYVQCTERIRADKRAKRKANANG